MNAICSETNTQTAMTLTLEIPGWTVIQLVQTTDDLIVTHIPARLPVSDHNPSEPFWLLVDAVVQNVLIQATVA